MLQSQQQQQQSEQNKMDDYDNENNKYDYEQYKLQKQMNRDIQVYYNEYDNINDIVENCRDNCIQQLEKRYEQYQELIHQEQQLEQPDQQNEFKQLQQYNENDEESQQLKQAIISMDQKRLWCYNNNNNNNYENNNNINNINDDKNGEIQFPEYMIPLYKRMLLLLILDILLITLICLFMPKFSMNLINDRVTTDIKIQFLIYWISTIIFLSSIIYLFSSIQLYRLRIAIATAVLNILWHLLLIIINYSNQSIRQQLFPEFNDAFYFIEFFINIILFITILLFSARFNVIANNSNHNNHFQYDQQLILQQQQEHQHQLKRQNQLQQQQQQLDQQELLSVDNHNIPLQQDQSFISSQIHPNRNQLPKSSTSKHLLNNMTKIPQSDNNNNNKNNNHHLTINQKEYNKRMNINDKNNNNISQLNDTIDKLNETRNPNFEETIYVNQNDIDMNQNETQLQTLVNQNDISMNHNNNIIQSTQNHNNSLQTDKDYPFKYNNDMNKQGNQIFTTTNKLHTDENVSIYQIEDNKMKRMVKPNQIYPIQDDHLIKKSEKLINQSNLGDKLYNNNNNTVQETQEKSISRVPSTKNISQIYATPNISNSKSLYRKDQSQMSLTTKNSTQNNLLDTTADRSLNLTNKQLLLISRIQSHSKPFQNNKSNLNNNFIKKQYDMNYWGSQFCEFSPAIKIRRTIEKYNIDIPNSIEDQKMIEIEQQRQLLIKKQEEERIKKMQNAEIELQKQIQLLQQNQQDLKKKHEQELQEKLLEKELNEKNLQQELNQILEQSERREKELKDREEQERLKKQQELENKQQQQLLSNNKKSALLLMEPTAIIQEEEEQNNSSLINHSNPSNSQQTPTLTRDNPNGQSKSKKQFKINSTLKIDPCILEAEESQEKEQNLIVFDDDFHDKDKDQYIDINTFVRNNPSLSALNSQSLSQFPLSVLREKDQDHKNSIQNQKKIKNNKSQKENEEEDEEDINHMKELQKLKDSQLINSNQINHPNLSNEYESINIDNNSHINNMDQSKFQGVKDLLRNTGGINNTDKSSKGKQGNQRYQNEQKYNQQQSHTIDKDYIIDGNANTDIPTKKQNVELSRLNQTLNSFYTTQSNVYPLNSQIPYSSNLPNQQNKKLMSQTISDTRRSENLSISRPSTVNNNIPILAINNFNKGPNNSNNNNNSILPNNTISSYQSAVNNNKGALQNLESHREIQKQNLIRQAENYLSNNNNGGKIQMDQGSSRMELIGEDDMSQQSPFTSQRDQNQFRILQDYRMKIIGINDNNDNIGGNDNDILKSIAQPESNDYSKSEYQKMKQMFTRGESNSRLLHHPLKHNSTKSKIDNSNSNLII